MARLKIDPRGQTDEGNKVAPLLVVDRNDMSKVTIFGVVFGLLAAGLVVLSSWQIPAPTTTVNKVITDDKLPK